MKTAVSVLHFNTAEDSVKIEGSVDVAILDDPEEKAKVETDPHKMSSKELSKKRATAKGKVTRIFTKLEANLKKVGDEALACEVTVNNEWGTLGILFNDFKARFHSFLKQDEKFANI